MAEERFVELSRSGHEPLEFAVVDTTPQSVASAFDVSYLLYEVCIQHD